MSNTDWNNDGDHVHVVAGMKPRVNIIAKSNGVGLDRDMRLLAAAFTSAGCEVSYARPASRQSGRRKSLLFKLLWRLRDRLFPSSSPAYDLNVMLEHVWIQYRRDARMNVFIPNPDFFDRHDRQAVGMVDGVWTKTLQAQQIFSTMHSRVMHLGFESEDRLLADTPRSRTFFHLAGSSALKGTERLLRIWSSHPEWPILVVAGRLKFQPPAAQNIQIHGGYLDDMELKRLQNQSLIHICTSEAEGWGHYLVEAMSVGAAVITVDAPPMNTLVTPDRGWLLPSTVQGRQGLLPRHVFDEHAFAATIDEVIRMSDEAITVMGQAGRRWYESNRVGFHQRLEQILSQIFVDL